MGLGCWCSVASPPPPTRFWPRCASESRLWFHWAALPCVWPSSGLGDASAGSASRSGPGSGLARVQVWLCFRGGSGLARVSISSRAGSRSQAHPGPGLALILPSSSSSSPPPRAGEAPLWPRLRTRRTEERGAALRPASGAGERRQRQGPCRAPAPRPCSRGPSRAPWAPGTPRRRGGPRGDRGHAG